MSNELTTLDMVHAMDRYRTGLDDEIEHGMALAITARLKILDAEYSGPGPLTADEINTLPVWARDHAEGYDVGNNGAVYRLNVDILDELLLRVRDRLTALEARVTGYPASEPPPTMTAVRGRWGESETAVVHWDGDTWAYPNSTYWVRDLDSWYPLDGEDTRPASQQVEGEG